MANVNKICSFTKHQLHAWYSHRCKNTHAPTQQSPCLCLFCNCRHSRALAVSCKATVQLEVPKTVTAPRQVPAKSVSLEPVVQEATAHYGKPLRGSPTTLGATYVKDAVSSVDISLQYVSAPGCGFVVKLAWNSSTSSCCRRPLLTGSGVRIKAQQRAAVSISCCTGSCSSSMQGAVRMMPCGEV